MSEQFLHSADVRPAFQEMRCEGMPEGVTSNSLCESRFAGGRGHCPLQHGIAARWSSLVGLVGLANPEGHESRDERDEKYLAQ